MANKEKTLNVNKYQNYKSYNDIPCKVNEVLVPFVIKKEMFKTNYINQSNLKTWKTAGTKYTVGFIPVDKTLFVEMVKNFWKDVNELVDPYREKRCFIFDDKGYYKRCPKENECNNCKHLNNYSVFSSMELSLDEMMYGLDEIDDTGYDPSGNIIETNKETAISMVNDLIDKANDINPRYASILQMLSEELPAKEIGERLGVKKSQTYTLIEKTLEFAKEILSKNK